MKLIVGLGNPGRKYQRTRHNLGFLLLDQLCNQAREKFDHEECQAQVEKIVLGNQRCLLAKPQTYMNLSGQAVACLVNKYHVEVNSDLLIVSDDVALPLGQLRMRTKGSAGGHNGLKSIIAALVTPEFLRLRLGIQPEEAIADLADFVLTKFAPAEEELVEQMILRAQEAILIWLEQGIDPAIAFTNKKFSYLIDM